MKHSVLKNIRKNQMKNLLYSMFFAVCSIAALYMFSTTKGYVITNFACVMLMLFLTALGYFLIRYRICGIEYTNLEERLIRREEKRRYLATRALMRK